mmetsp:Transcript_108503/g.188395  ORF Transcript_108503/g.188395 Transcript_108503/m.188395 type:complete len:256 (-) Transcript_108503:74-841(-)
MTAAHTVVCSGVAPAAEFAESSSQFSLGEFPAMPVSSAAGGTRSSVARGRRSRGSNRKTKDDELLLADWMICDDIKTDEDGWTLCEAIAATVPNSEAAKARMPKAEVAEAAEPTALSQEDVAKEDAFQQKQSYLEKLMTTTPSTSASDGDATCPEGSTAEDDTDEAAEENTSPVSSPEDTPAKHTTPPGRQPSAKTKAQRKAELRYARKVAQAEDRALRKAAAMPVMRAGRDLEDLSDNEWRIPSRGSRRAARMC